MYTGITLSFWCDISIEPILISIEHNPKVVNVAFQKHRVVFSREAYFESTWDTRPMS